MYKRIIYCCCGMLLSLLAQSQEIQKVKIADLEKIISEARHPTIINFWATWCKPCVEELPYFMEEVKQHKADSLQLILVSLDFPEAFPEKILAFAKNRKIGAQIMWLDETNADYFCPKIDSSWSGAIPASLLINPATGYSKFFEEQIPREKLKEIIMAILQKD